jgi:hypothetical protein
MLLVWELLLENFSLSVHIEEVETFHVVKSAFVKYCCVVEGEMLFVINIELVLLFFCSSLVVGWFKDTEVLLVVSIIDHTDPLVTMFVVVLPPIS